MLQGLMQELPLLISSLIRHADRHHGDTEIVSRTVEGAIHRTNYREAHARSRKLANALAALGVVPSERIGTLAWNSYRHFEIYYGSSGIGVVCHTINPRLFPEQIAYIINHAEDGYVFFDLTFLPLVEALAQLCPCVKGWIALTDSAHLPKSAHSNLLCYEELLEAQSDRCVWPELDERLASSLCYTSGTTGKPKGVLYSNRSTVLHAYAIALPDALDLSAREVVLPVVPMFHVNAWGMPYACPLVGAKLVFPGAALDGKSLYELLETEKVTLTAGVPTVWLNLLTFMRQECLKFSSLKRVAIGGAPATPAMIKAFQDEFGVQVVHAWGMTETSPVGTVSTHKARHDQLDAQARQAVQARAGRVVYGVDMKIVDAGGRELPWDGKAFGEILVRGPWICRKYFKDEGGDPLRRDENGHEWFPTGDVATIDPDGFMQITDRAKDVIKSGGEWISSISLENIAVAHPAVAEAAVIGIAHPKWGERPLLVVVKKAGARVTREELLSFYEGKIARMCTPDDIVFVDQLPHTATGKLLKTKLRQDFKDYILPTA